MNLITIIFFALIILSIFVFIFYKRIVVASFLLLNIIFALSLLSSLAALFAPFVFTAATESFLSNSSFGMQLQSADNTIKNVGNIPNDLKNRIEDLFNREEQSNQSDLAETPGLYVTFVNFISGLLRIFTLILATIVMVVSVYIRYAFGGLKETSRLEIRNTELEKRIQALELIIK